MPQNIFPNATVDAGNWTPVGSGTIHGALDSSDFTYAESPADPSSEVFLVEIGTPALPVPPISHILKFRGNKTVAGIPTSLNVSLYQGGTFIAGSTLSITSTLLANYQYDASAFADQITDYTDLRLRASGSGSGSGNKIQIVSFYLELPVQSQVKAVGGSIGPSGVRGPWGVFALRSGIITPAGAVGTLVVPTMAKAPSIWLTRRGREEV